MRNPTTTISLLTLLLWASGCLSLRSDLPDAELQTPTPDAALAADGQTSVEAEPRDMVADAGVAPGDLTAQPMAQLDAPPIGPDVAVAMDVPMQACTNGCVPGAQECVGTAIKTCVKLVNGCAGWEAAKGCPTPQSCVANACVCDSTCDLGTKECGPGGGLRQCVQDGACRKWGSETACTIENATAKCEQSLCSIASCNAGYNRCGAACVRTDDVNACGSSCTKCPSVMNGSALCSNGICSERCNPGYGKCVLGSACERNAWTFESGTDEGVVAVNLDGQTGGLTGDSHTGSKAMAVTTSVAANGIMIAEFNIQKGCSNSGGLAVSGRTLSAWVYGEVDTVTTLSTCSFSYVQDNMYISVPATTVMARRWTRITTPVLAGGISYIQLNCACAGKAPVRWILDDVAIE